LALINCDFSVYLKPEIFFKVSHFGTLEDVQDNEMTESRIFRKLFPEMSPGMAEILKCVFKSTWEYFEDDHT
jgi:hypothetical protein